MLESLFTTQTNKQIHLYENVLDYSERNDFFEFVKNSFYKTTGMDSYNSGKKLNQIFSQYDNNDLQKIGFIDTKIFKQLDIIHNFSKRKILQVRVNCSNCFEHSIAHIDKNNGITLIYCVNLEWNIFDGGHTLFLNESLSDIEFTSIYKPNKIVVFDGGIPHCISPISIEKRDHRYSFVIQYGELN